MTATPVRVLETGFTYPSLASAVRAVAKRKTHGRDYASFQEGKPVAGFHIIPDDTEPNYWLQTKYRRRCRPVRCIDNGARYPSISHVADVFRVPPSTIYRAIRYHRRVGGYRWEYADD